MNKTENAILADSLRKISTALTAIADVLDAPAKGVKKEKKGTIEAPMEAPDEKETAPMGKAAPKVSAPDPVSDKASAAKEEARATEEATHPATEETRLAKEKAKASEEVPAATLPTYTKEEVRKILAAKAGQDFGPQVKEIIHQHGADNLTGLDPKEYDAVVKEVEALHA